MKPENYFIMFYWYNYRFTS